MKTIVLSPQFDKSAVKNAANLLLQGEVVGMPTETVYGLAANALNGEAVAKISARKDVPQDNPLIVHIADFDQIYDLCPAVPPQAKALAEAFWPGPLTMIVPKGDCIPDEVSCGLETVGIRLPSHPLARDLIRTAGVPLAAPSANTSGRPSTTTAEHVLHDMDGKIAAILDGGPCGRGCGIDRGHPCTGQAASAAAGRHHAGTAAQRARRGRGRPCAVREDRGRREGVRAGHEVSPLCTESTGDGCARRPTKDG